MIPDNLKIWLWWNGNRFRQSWMNLSVDLRRFLNKYVQDCHVVSIPPWREAWELQCALQKLSTPMAPWYHVEVLKYDQPVLLKLFMQHYYDYIMTWEYIFWAIVAVGSKF
jgi:hypothetical protein